VELASGAVGLVANWHGWRMLVFLLLQFCGFCGWVFVGSPPIATSVGTDERSSQLS